MLELAMDFTQLVVLVVLVSMTIVAVYLVASSDISDYK